MATRKYTPIPYTEYPVSEGNFDTTRKPIDLVVLHHTATTYAKAIAHFGSSTAKASAHYIVSNNGNLAAMLEEYYTAYHAGQYAVNQRSIGIETEWYEGMGDRSTALYEKVSALVADICNFYAIPIDTDHIKPHKTFTATQCPGTLDIPRIIDRARAIASPAPVETPLQACLRMHKDAVTELDALKKEHGKCFLLNQENISLKMEIDKVKKENTAKQSEINTLNRRNDELEKVLLEIKASVSRL